MSPTDQHSQQHRKSRNKDKGRHAGLSVRQAAASILDAVLKGSVFEPLGVTQMPDDRDRALANRLVTEALRRHVQLGVILTRYLERGLPARSGMLRAALHIGLTELLFLDGAEHAALFLSVELVRADRRARRFDKLANAVLRQTQRDADHWRSMDARSALEGTFAVDLAQRFGDEAVTKIGEALLVGADLDLTAHYDAAVLADRVGGEALNDQTVRLIHRDRKVNALTGYDEGAFFVQDVAAALPMRLIDCAPGARVLDMCAAPGGKTAQLCLAGYDVVAVDSDARRMERVEANLVRLNLQADVIVADGTEYMDEAGFDAILLDAPCSATGTFRRHPEVLINRTSADIERLVKLQRRLLAHAATLLKPGGTLVYCVCSLDAREGESQLDWVRDNLPGLAFDPLPVADHFCGIEGAIAAPGVLRTHAGLGFASEVAAQTDELAGMDGFFAARFRRV